MTRSPLPLALAAGILVYAACDGLVPAAPEPCPHCPVNPSPEPRPDPAPRPKPKPPCPCPKGAEGQESTVAGREYNGDELTVDLPGAMHIKNVGAKKDGAGMCVDSSIEMQALSLGMDFMKGFRDWAAVADNGGSYPGKVDDQLKRYCALKGVPVPSYIQVEEGPKVIAEVARKLDSTGRCFCSTYGVGPRYNNQQIAHMIFVVRFGDKYGVVLDNNFPGESNYEWMTLDELVRRICYPSGQGWIFSFLVPAGANKPLHNR